MSDEEQARTPFLEQVKSLGGVYWIANWMELVERFAYYGVRTVLPVFMVLAISEGGPELTHLQKGTIYGIWALVQSFVPIFSGVYADRYGYKPNIALSTVLKIVGYLVMGYCIVLAEMVAGMPLAEAREAHVDHTYEIFFAGAMLLALGTAVFKPGVQGLIATKMPDKSASLGWGLFYQMVNIGGFLGPLIAGYLRVLEWEYVFVTCAAAIALNFLPLFVFREPEKAQVDTRGFGELTADALRGLLEPKLFYFSLAFAGFWLMFYQLFDILPNFIDDWVDSREPAAVLQSILPTGWVPVVNGGNLTQEWMINLNAGLISLFAFLVGYWTGKVRALIAIVAGIAVAALGIFGLGMGMSGWIILGAIAVFSVGEMMSSPTKMRYLSSIAPPGRKGQYMGYVNMTVGIGWSIGSVLAGSWYEEGGDKVNLARRYLEEHLHVSHADAAAIDRADVVSWLMESAHVDAWGARELLWNTYDPAGMWLWFTLIGLGSMCMLVAYDRIVRKAHREPDFSFNTHGRRWVQAVVVPTALIVTGCAVYQAVGLVQADKTVIEVVLGSLALSANAALLLALAIASFVMDEEKIDDAPPKPVEF
ncbi:MAG: MFS transporter [Sandaracinaceae bacterium]|nr:MFS transporter [Sandaracinaceae bacterium]